MQPQSVKQFIRYPNGVRCRAFEPADGRDETTATPGGICFPTTQSLDAGTLVEVRLGTPQGEERVMARVAWSRPEDDRYLTGARLLDDADACKARLAAQLCLIDAYRREACACGRDLDEDTAASEWIARYAHQVPAIT